MPDVRAGEPVLTGKTIFGLIIGMIVGILVLGVFWIPLLGFFKGIEWVVVIISFGVFLLGYKLIKYTEGAPDVIGAIITMLGFTLLVFAVWYWAPFLALNFPIIPQFPYVTWGLIIGSVALIIGIILIKKYQTTERHLNDVGEIIGPIFGGFMIYVWVIELLIVPLLELLGVNIIAQVKGIPWPLSLFI